MSDTTTHHVDLGDGLVMRPALIEDGVALAEFNAIVFGESNGGRDEQAAAWSRDLLRGDHPTSPISDHSLVEISTKREIVSSCLLVSQEWTYAGIPCGVGRPELVGTHPNFRGRGLVGKQFERLHEISAARGQLVQAITGIPNFYRRFGYEPALIVSPAPEGPASAFPSLPSHETEQYTFRAATDDDIAFIDAMYGQSTQRSTIAAIRDETLWRYELTRDSQSDFIHDILVIEPADGTPVGLIAHVNQLRRGRLATTLAEVRPEISWPSVVEPIMRCLRQRAEALGQQSGETNLTLSFDLVPNHPLLRLTASRIRQTVGPFAWYVRVPDLVAFLQRITLALERRLAASFLAGYTGVLELTLFQSGLRLAFDGGRVISIEPWRPDSIWRADAALPEKAFLYLVFGSRTLSEIEHAFPDTRIRTDLARVLLDTLFPPTHSVIWPIG